MNNIKTLFAGVLLLISVGCAPKPQLTSYVNPFLGTATLWDSVDLGYTPTRRTWGAEVFPGASLPNAMVQATPVTLFRSGSGYQYEDTVIQAFVHTSKGHWNLCHVPILPVTGDVTPRDYASPYSHDKEAASPGYYRVFLDRYMVNAELATTLRCAFHRHTFRKGDDKKLMFDLSRANEHVRKHELEQQEDNVLTGFQELGETMYFYAVSNMPIKGIETKKEGKNEISVVEFDDDSKKPLEVRIGFSFVSVENAKENLRLEMEGKSFTQVKAEAENTWEELLSKIKVEGGTEEQKGTFYSSLYRSFLWPVLRSDANGDFSDRKGEVFNKGFHYYTEPSFWDDYRNKLVLLGMISPEVTADVISSLNHRGERSGFMQTFFHGDHASVFITGTYLRGIRGYDVEKSYQLMLNNATVTEGNRIRPHMAKYLELGYVPEQDLKDPLLWTVANAGVTKTLEYAYDDYAVALLAKELGDVENYEKMMARTGNYKNVFDPSTGFMRGRLENGEWITPFDPGRPFYEYMYREANAWQSTFFAPHDPKGLIALYPNEKEFEMKMDSLFTVPWEGYEAHNMSVFIGQYCHGNQPDHNFPYMYYFIGQQEKTQKVLDKCLNEFYNMGEDGLALAGMDDAGEMSSWYVLNAIGLYTFSPADPEYIVTVPLFDKVEFTMGDGSMFKIKKVNSGDKITGITYDGTPVDGYFITHDQLTQGKDLVITVE